MNINQLRQSIDELIASSHDPEVMHGKADDLMRDWIRERSTTDEQVEWEPELTLTEIPPDDYSATIIYEVHGGDQVDTHSIELEGSQYSYDSVFIGIDSCDYELTAVPVRIREG